MECRSVSRVVSKSVSRSVSRVICKSVSRSVSRVVSKSVSRSVSRTESGQIQFGSIFIVLGHTYMYFGCTWEFIRSAQKQLYIYSPWLNKYIFGSLWKCTKAIKLQPLLNRFKTQTFISPGVWLSRLCDMNNYSVVTADVTTEHFGNAHNIVGNEETDFIYVVGVTARTDYTCDGKNL